MDGLRSAWLDWLAPWDSYYAVVDELIEASDGRVVALNRDRARPKDAKGETYFEGATVWTVRGRKVARVEFYWNRAEAFAAAGLAP
jgi:ketosteroid isomerase-like protein